MKKILLLVSVLVVAAACAAPPTNREATTANTNLAETKSAAMTEAGAIANEKAVWDAIKNKNYDAFASMLAPDQLEVTSDGVNDKAASVASVREFEPSEVNLSDWKFLSIDKDAFLIIYTANTKGKYKGKEFPPITARSSSAWVNRDGKWLAIYHQECAVKPAMTPAAAKSSAKAASSPAASPAMAVASADAIADEKLVWDLFKTKNYDGFASLLASDFVEVEPDKVYDKAGSVEGIKGFDASKATLSDWKSLKLDDDAALVTYTVKLTGTPGAGERHSSIWANRNGKWLAVFHHGGTEITAPGAAASPTATPKASASPAMKATPSPATKASPAAKPSATR
ncbi:MAG: DUF4440 domain-containing protein [Acidobacteriota bacterium]|nr:DUF4440 domain-containing protein [Acidobacteriota bacterium]